jgi:hypothetical protein
MTSHAAQVGATPEGEHATVPGHKPVAGSVGGRCDPDDRLVEAGVADRAAEAGTSKGEHATIPEKAASSKLRMPPSAATSHQPVAGTSGGRTMPTMGWLRCRPAVDPK